MLRSLAGRFGSCAIAALLLLTVRTFGQVQVFSSFTQPTPSTAKYTLSGTVVNSVTGQPIRRALVQIYAGIPRSVLTDANGQFEFADIPPTSTNVSVRKPGFFEERELDPSRFQVVRADSQPLVLKLVPEAIIFGRIEDSEGAPVENLPVRLYRTRIADGRKRWDQVSGANTNGDGEFRLANLVPGTYYLEAGPGRLFREPGQPRKVRRAYPGLFYPGVAEMSGATPLQLSSGQQISADFSLTPAQFFKVSGTVESAGAGPMNIELLDDFGNSIAVVEQFDAVTRQFQAQVPAGSHRLIATAWGEGGIQSSGELPLIVNSDITGIKIPVTLENSIPVYVRKEATHPSSAASRTAFVPELRLTSTDETKQQTYAAVAEGYPRKLKLNVRNISPGTYFADVNANPPWYVQSAQCGTVDLLRNQLTVVAGVQTPPIEMVLRDDGATLTAHISSLAEGARATVIVAPESGSSFRAQTIVGNTVAFDNLAPGSYSVFAFDRADDLEYRNREVLDRYSSRAAHISLQPGGQQDVNLELIAVSN